MKRFILFIDKKPTAKYFDDKTHAKEYAKEKSLEYPKNFFEIVEENLLSFSCVCVAAYENGSNYYKD